MPIFFETAFRSSLPLIIIIFEFFSLNIFSYSDMSIDLWLPSKLNSIIKNADLVGSEKTERIGKCLFLAKNKGGQFWPLLERAADQIISEYHLSESAKIFLLDNIKCEWQYQIFAPPTHFPPKPGIIGFWLLKDHYDLFDNQEQPYRTDWFHTLSW